MNFQNRAQSMGCLFLGLVPVEPHTSLTSEKKRMADQHYRNWITSGGHAEMAWLENQVALKTDPGLVLPGARSVLVFALPWNISGTNGPRDAGTPSSGSEMGRIASYARGPDYHKRFRRMLQGISDELSVQFPGSSQRILIDANPLSERFFAAITGQGFIGRNTMFIIPGLGSRFFLSTLLSSIPPEALGQENIEIVGKANMGSFSSCPAGCRLCLDACPTGALRESSSVRTDLDARRCLSYHTIECRKGIPDEYRGALGQRIFGCETCLDVCPFNHEMPLSTEYPIGKALAIHSQASFAESFAGTSIMRAGWRQFLLTACIAAANSGNQDFRQLLERLSRHPDETIQAHANWGLVLLSKKI